MAEFLSDLTFIFELFAIAAGLVLLDRVAASGGGFTRLAGWLLVIGGILTALCTGYYWLKYKGQGDFDRAYPPAMMQDMQGMGMKGGMMQMMHGGKKGMGMQGGKQGMGMQGGMMGDGMNRDGTRMPRAGSNPEEGMDNQSEADHNHAEGTEKK